MRGAWWLVGLAVMALLSAGCGSGDPEPTVGDAEITKDMPAQQAPPPSAALKEKAAAPQTPALPLDK